LGETAKLRVGITWAAGHRPGRPAHWYAGDRRNIPLAKLASLAHSDIEFHSLQKGERAESELTSAVSQGWSGPRILTHSDLLRDFSDTAALIEVLDLVISVDTATAHLAGALAKPLWIMNCHTPCWRWLLDREESPWYPTARLFRQELDGDWDGVVSRIAAELFRLVM
jgi:hypothetical protein